MKTKKTVLNRTVFYDFYIKNSTVVVLIYSDFLWLSFLATTAPLFKYIFDK